MSVMAYADFLSEFRLLCSAFGKRTEGDEWDRLKSVYWRTCKALDSAEWVYSVANAIENETRFPFPARLIGSARERRKVDVSRCRACGKAQATFREWCGACALERPEESGIRIDRADEEQDDERRRIEVVKANPRQAGESAADYVHRLALAMGLIAENAEPVPF